MQFHVPVPLSCLLFLLGFSAETLVFSATYEVGPGKAHTTIGSVPWDSLQPGDAVRIYWKSEPYKEKWVICRRGTPSAYIRITGVPNPSGELPVIDGDGAVTAPRLNYWNEERSIIKIGGANVPSDTTPSNIVLENLEIRNASEPYAFTGDDGTVRRYARNASAIHIEKGFAIIVRRCRIYGNGNGVFVGSSNDVASQNITIEGNYIFGNGNSGSLYEHNAYTAGVNVIYQYNRFGPPRAGSGGNALKDRSAGLIVRYNWIDGGNRLMDLVDGEDSVLIRNQSSYRETYVYGNVLIKQDGLNRQVIHYGGDSGTIADYRKGTLYFYNNTLYSLRAQKTTVLRLSTNDERCDARNNIFHVAAAGGNLALLEESGVLELNRNWATTGYRTSHTTFAGELLESGPMIQGKSPDFLSPAAEDFSLAPTSTAIGAAAVLNPRVLPANDVRREYRKHQSSTVLKIPYVLDLGAFQSR